MKSHWDQIEDEIHDLTQVKTFFNELEEYEEAIKALHIKHKRLLRYLRKLRKGNISERAIAMVIEDVLRKNSK